MRYELTKDLECGNAMVDNEHRELLQAVNKLLDACSQGNGRKSIKPTADFLLKYVATHFAHEEQLQQKVNYPNIDAHKKFHAEYTKKLKDITAAIPDTDASLLDLSNLNRHIAALISHIKIEDKRLCEYINSKK